MRILLVEDDTILGAAVRARSMPMANRWNGSRVWMRRPTRCAASSYDLILLDLMLPDGRGIGFFEGLRARGDGTPDITLTALDQVSDRISNIAGLVEDIKAAEWHAEAGTEDPEEAPAPNW